MYFNLIVGRVLIDSCFNWWKNERERERERERSQYLHTHTHIILTAPSGSMQYRGFWNLVSSSMIAPSLVSLEKLTCSGGFLTNVGMPTSMDISWFR